MPKVVTTDNGPEFTGKALHLWAQRNSVHLNHIQPGKPMQTGFIESSNGTFRDDCLNQHWFSSITEARLLINHWRTEYNQIRGHHGESVIGYRRCLEAHQKETREHPTLIQTF